MILTKAQKTLKRLHGTVDEFTDAVINAIGEISKDEALKRVRVMDELRRFGIGDYQVIISTNLVLRQDGAPRSGQAAPVDPGVAVYWRHGKEQRCMAIDRYDRVAGSRARLKPGLAWSVIGSNFWREKHRAVNGKGKGHDDIEHQPNASAPGRPSERENREAR